MALKRTIKRSEARILIFIKNADKINKNLTNISKKLDIDFAYMTKIINTMHSKYWIKKQRIHNQTFIELAHNCPAWEEIIEARK